ncbi:FAD dependent oxidoreductase-domain-containing protein [Lasiosphaeria miniovina]|uniref:FAD dependent oxidoreductase-domain-containing protein n=1 Tax=Lasiosphaeria miniovina TaxID=1954250 RepID=A0AA40E530_9PEZI|nr:FAD dependent oxidoreductase-domain-containing protein [Lasiosphaeria miniovina]KAK0728509.1 FAD dependent oxidoreductase-domain-containing protein [Lasiosphaeria miniovina]
MAVREVAGLPTPTSTAPIWLKEPSATLQGHRTTADLPALADVVVVGTGITGSFAARFLKAHQKPGTSLVVLDAREACWGATGRNGGHCQPLLYTAAASPGVAEFELATFAYLESLAKTNDIPCDWTSLSGVHTFLAQDLFDLAAAAVNNLERSRPDLAALVRIVRPPSDTDAAGTGTGKETLASLRIPHAAGAIVQKHAATLWPYKLVAWVLEQLLAQFPPGEFNLQTNTPVTFLQQRRHQDESNSLHPWLLTTPRGTIAARQVLLATNAYTSHLLPAFADLIVPVRGQVAALVPPPAAARGESDDPIALGRSYVIMDHASASARDDYLAQRPVDVDAVAGSSGKRGGSGSGGELIFGGGRPSQRGQGVGVWNDDELEEPVARYLRTNLSPPLDLTPDDNDGDDTRNPSHRPKEEDGVPLDATYEWTGIMGFSRDHHAWVGRVPASLGGSDDGDQGGLWLCAGYSGHGMPVAALAARAVAEQMTMTMTTTEEDVRAVEETKLPAEMALTADRVRRVRESCETVLEADQRGWAAHFPDLLLAAGRMDPAGKGSSVSVPVSVPV